MLEEKKSNQLTSDDDKDLREEAKKIIEAILFASSTPLTINKISQVVDHYTPFSKKVLKELIDELEEEYRQQKRAFCLEEIAEGYVLRSNAMYGAYVHLLHQKKKAERLSQASLEVLSIVAYRQPITRPKIDALRGVDSSGIVHTLLDRELIEPVGKLEVPGRPTLYGTTNEFLQHFGLKDLDELPSFELTEDS